MRNELYVEVQNVGFGFGVDTKRKRNYVHPAFLSFFSFAAKPYHMNTSDEMVPDDGIIHLENIEPMDFSEAFHFCGKQLVLCHDKSCGYAECIVSHLNAKVGSRLCHLW